MKRISNIVISGLALALAASTAQAQTGLRGQSFSTSETQQAATAAAVPTPTELEFVPINQPCRIFDSHATTPLTANTPRAVFINQPNYDFTKQGATVSKGCGIPASAAGVAVSITTSSSTTSGALSATPGGVNAVNTTVSYAPSGNATGDGSLGVRANRINLRPTAGSTHATVDVTGFLVPQIEAFINPDGTIFSATARILSVTHPTTGQYRITIDRNVQSCAVQATVDAAGSGGIRGFANTTVGDNLILIYTARLNGGALQPSDQFFNLSAHC